MTINRRQFLSTMSRASAFAAAAPHCLKGSPWHRNVLVERAVFAMGTTVSFSVYGETKEHALAATSRAIEDLYRMDRLLSVFREDSDISRLNRSAGLDAVELQKESLLALQRAKEFAEITGSVFDPTVGGLMKTWGFWTDAALATRPLDAELAAACDGIGAHRLEIIDDHTARLSHPSTRIDLGGIGVGFTVDRMGEILRREGVRAALINHSGDLLAIGAPPDAEGWHVEIPDPLDHDRALMTLLLRDEALSTSSNRQTRRYVGRHSVGHIFDPRTLMNPSTNLCVSVRVRTSVEADALSTALFVDANATGLEWNSHREAYVVRPERRERIIERLR